MTMTSINDIFLCIGFHAASVKYISQFEAVDDSESVNKVIVTILGRSGCAAGVGSGSQRC